MLIESNSCLCSFSPPHSFLTPSSLSSDVPPPPREARPRPRHLLSHPRPASARQQRLLSPLAPPDHRPPARPRLQTAVPALWILLSSHSPCATIFLHSILCCSFRYQFLIIPFSQCAHSCFAPSPLRFSGLLFLHPSLLLLFYSLTLRCLCFLRSLLLFVSLLLTRRLYRHAPLCGGPGPLGRWLPRLFLGRQCPRPRHTSLHDPYRTPD